MLRRLAWLLPLMYAIPVFADCTAASGPNRVALLELYTSEGCSSCPPADKWLSGIAAAGYGTDKVIPLAFHVDYWDYIGWKDKFANADYSARQREIAATNAAGFVYTPQVVFNGEDLRGWQQNSRFSQTVSHSLQQPARAKLNLDISTLDSGAISVNTSAQTIKPQDRQYADVYIAVYENNLSSAVNAGENSGRRLHHDYVVRQWMGPYRLDAKSDSAWQRSFTLNADWKKRDAGVAAFVQDRRTGDVLQALALKICS